MYDRIVQWLLPRVEFHQNRYARELDDLVRPRCRWLDIGAGARVHSGWVGASQAELVRRARMVCGCDLVPEHLAANAYLSARAVADAGRLPFADASFDLVSANMVLEHLAEPARVLGEVARVLVPGGTFVFVTPNRRHPLVWLLAAAVPPTWRRAVASRIEGRPREHVFPTFYRANTAARLAVLAEHAGLEVRRLSVFPSFPMLRRPWPLTLLEALGIRVLGWGPVRGLASNLLGVFEKPAGRRAEECGRVERVAARAA